ncbi:MAG TPA: HD domain-containing phosphohydrolase [Gaiellaceae bacterium]|nr:HD domain-containing phosphohydrolase [Gaiellaceae bacterium]
MSGDGLITIEAAGSETVQALARALELHDYGRGYYAETAAHSARVTQLALQLAERVEPELAADPRLEWGFRLHDIGMLGVSNAILRKRGRLTFDELAQVREHPLLGERIVAPVSYLNGIARQVIGAHHERWDGSGYPRRLEADRIPLAARIFTLADVYDAMTSDQPYRDALPIEVVLEHIADGSGAQFDPDLADPFLALVQELAAA